MTVRPVYPSSWKTEFLCALKRETYEPNIGEW